MFRRSAAKRGKGSEIWLKVFFKAQSPSDPLHEVQHKPDAFMEERDVGNDIISSAQVKHSALISFQAFKGHFYFQRSVAPSKHYQISGSFKKK